MCVHHTFCRSCSTRGIQHSRYLGVGNVVLNQPRLLARLCYPSEVESLCTMCKMKNSCGNTSGANSNYEFRPALTQSTPHVGNTQTGVCNNRHSTLCPTCINRRNCSSGEWRKDCHTIASHNTFVREMTTTVMHQCLKFEPCRRVFFFGIKNGNSIGGFFCTSPHRIIEICTTKRLTTCGGSSAYRQPFTHQTWCVTVFR